MGVVVAISPPTYHPAIGSGTEDKDPSKATWTFFTNHGLVLLAVAPGRPAKGIPLLLLLEGQILEVDVAMLLSDVFPAEPVLDLPEGRVKRVATRLGRAWLSQWE